MALALNDFSGAETGGLKEASATVGTPSAPTANPRSGARAYRLAAGRDHGRKTRRRLELGAREDMVRAIAEPVCPRCGGAVAPIAGETLRRGPLELRQDTHRAYWRGAQVELTLSEFAIVRYMAIRSGGDVTYRQIYDVVRGKDFAAGYGSDGFRANVRSFIKRIRKKFRDVDPEFDQIDKYHGFGYRWRDVASRSHAGALYVLCEVG